MKAAFDNLYSMAGVAGRLPPDLRITILDKLVGMLEKALARGPNSSPRTESVPSGSSIINSGRINSGTMQAAAYFDSESVPSAQSETARNLMLGFLGLTAAKANKTR